NRSSCNLFILSIIIKNIFFYAGVSKIKKMIIIISAVLLLAGLFFLGSFIKKQYTLQQIQEAPQQEIATDKENEEEEEEDADKDDNENEEENEEESKDSPLKDYLNEKAERAMDRFFTKELNVVAMGDSLTEGVGDEKNNGYVGILDDSINHNTDIVKFET